MLVAPLLFAPAAVADTSVVPDPGLAACINDKLKRPTDQVVTVEDIESITFLSCNSKYAVADLTGLEHLTNAYSLGLGHSRNITDLTPLAGLTQLTTLMLDYAGHFASVEPLRNLTALEHLTLNSAPVGDISPLAGMTRLKYLTLNNLGVSDIEVLAGMTQLESLALNANDITDVTPVAGLTSLTRLILSGNDISDLSPLGPELIDGLTFLNLSGNQITDLSRYSLPHDVLANDQVISAGNVYVPFDTNAWRYDTEYRLGDLELPRSWSDAGTSWVSAGINSPFTAGNDTGAVDGTSASWQIDAAPEDWVDYLWFSFTDPNVSAKYNGYFVYEIWPAWIVDTAPVDGRVGEEYAFAFELIDPEAPYGDFTLTGDVPGLSLTADGTLQGTPTQAGTYTIEVEARDTWGNVINRTYTLHIDGALAPVEPTPTPIEPTPTPTPTEPTPTPTEPTPTPIDGSGSGNGSGAGNGSGTGNGSLANTGADQSGLWITAVGVVAAGIVLVTGAGLRRRSSR